MGVSAIIKELDVNLSGIKLRNKGMIPFFLYQVLEHNLYQLYIYLKSKLPITTLFLWVVLRIPIYYAQLTRKKSYIKKIHLRFDSSLRLKDSCGCTTINHILQITAPWICARFWILTSVSLGLLPNCDFPDTSHPFSKDIVRLISVDFLLCGCLRSRLFGLFRLTPALHR